MESDCQEEKARISIAAMIKSSIILDEATSSLDSQTESKIKALNTLTK